MDKNCDNCKHLKAQKLYSLVCSSCWNEGKWEANKLQAENKRLKETQNSQSDYIHKLEAERGGYMKALEKIRYCIKTGELGISEIELTVDEALQTKEEETK